MSLPTAARLTRRRRGSKATMTSIGRIDKTRWQALSPLLDELLDLDVAHREARLARLRSDDPPLAADVESLLAREDAVERNGFLEGSALPAEATLARQTIGSYTLDRPLGQGGMGSVWLAHRSDGRFEGQAAIKFLNLALVARGGAERFRREGDVLAKLSHPNIARLLDAGIAAGGQPYLVLEFVDGEPIDRWCETRGLSVEARVRLFLEALAAVGFAHENLILHRDLKPANILVTAEGHVKLLDFGIAKLLDEGEQGAPATELTQLAGRAFTPEYAAPEQIQGGDVTTATDVYALGVLLYRLLSGEHPTAMPANNPVDQLRAVVETVPARLSQAAARTTHRGVTGTAHTVMLPARALRGDLDNIAAKALKKLPRERYATVAAFADDLNRYLNDEPVTARPDSRSYRAAKFVQRHRLGVGAASATLLALIAGVIGTTWQAIEARRERDAAVFQAERALAKGNLVGLMLGAMGQADRPLTQREILERSLELVEKQFLHDPRIAVDLLLPIAGQYLTLGDTAREYAVMQRAGAIATASGDPNLIAEVVCSIVETELLRDRIDLARSQLETGQKALAQMKRQDLGTVVSCMLAEADVARRQGDLERAIARVGEAIALAERVGHTRGNSYPKLLSFLGATQLQRGDLIASYDTFKKLQRLDEQLGRTETVDYLLERRNEAVLLAAFGEYVDARALVESIVPRWSMVTGDDSLPAWLSHSRGVLMYRFGDLEGAQRELVATAERLRAQGNVDRALNSDLALARVLLELGRTGEAERLLAPIEAAGSPRASRSGLVTTTTVRAELLLAQRALPQAEQVIEDELAAIGHPTARDSAALATALRVAARVQLASGNGGTAQQRAADAVAVSERVARDPAKSADVGEGLLLLAQAQRALGQDAESAETARRAARSLSSGLGEGHRLTQEALALAGR
jgi:serine/threonine-protein kinase